MSTEQELVDRFCTVRAELAAGNTIQLELTAGALRNIDTGESELCLLEVIRRHGSSDFRSYVPLVAFPPADYILPLDMSRIVLASRENVRQDVDGHAEMSVAEALINVAEHLGTVNDAVRELLNEAGRAIECNTPA